MTNQEAACEKECISYSWCKGISSLYSARRGITRCRLLAEQKPETNISGWDWKDDGNWVEPDQWKNGATLASDTAACYEKIQTGVYIT